MLILYFVFIIYILTIEMKFINWTKSTGEINIKKNEPCLYFIGGVESNVFLLMLYTFDFFMVNIKISIGTSRMVIFYKNIKTFFVDNSL